MRAGLGVRRALAKGVAALEMPAAADVREPGGQPARPPVTLEQADRLELEGLRQHGGHDDRGDEQDERAEVQLPDPCDRLAQIAVGQAQVPDEQGAEYQRGRRQPRADAELVQDPRDQLRQRLLGLLRGSFLCGPAARGLHTTTPASGVGRNRDVKNRHRGWRPLPILWYN